MGSENFPRKASAPAGAAWAGMGEDRREAAVPAMVARTAWRRSRMIGEVDVVEND